MREDLNDHVLFEERKLVQHVGENPCKPLGVLVDFLLEAPSRDQNVYAFTLAANRCLDGQRDGQSNRRAAVNNRMLTEQYDFAVGGLTLAGFRTYGLAREVLGNLLSLPDLDFAGFDQAFHHGFEILFRHTRGAGDASRVQVHVVLLDTVGGKRAQGGKVLCKPDGAHDARKLGSIRRSQQPVIDAHARIRLE